MVRASNATLPEEAGEIGDLGRILRQRRSVRGLSLQQVATESGISVGQLSGIERGLYAPTLATIRRICETLQMPPRWLFDRPESAGPENEVVVRARCRRQLVLEASGILKEMLTPDEAGNIQMLRMVIAPDGGWSGAFSPPSRTIAARCGLVLSGTLELCLDDDVFVLSAGDSFGTEPRQRIAFRCVGETPCEVIWVTTPAVY